MIEDETAAGLTARVQVARDSAGGPPRPHDAPKEASGLDQVRGRPVQFCATCVFIERVPGPAGKGVHRCARLGFGTSPRYSFHCWTPRASYRWAVTTDGDDALAPGDGANPRP